MHRTFRKQEIFVIIYCKRKVLHENEANSTDMIMHGTQNWKHLSILL